MSDILRIEKNVPEVYVNESRDFQVLCRVFTALVADLRNSIDSSLQIIDTDTITLNFIPLLQNKLGFFTRYKIDNEAIRVVLRSFPAMVRNKGSLKSIEQAVETFLKVYNLKTKANIQIVHEKETVYGKEYDHTVIIKLTEEAWNSDDTLLKEIFRYILPVGFKFVVIKSLSSDVTTIFTESNEVKAIVVSDDINSDIRGSQPQYVDLQNELIGAVDTIEVKGNDPSENVGPINASGNDSQPIEQED